MLLSVWKDPDLINFLVLSILFPSCLGVQRSSGAARRQLAKSVLKLVTSTLWVRVQSNSSTYQDALDARNNLWVRVQSNSSTYQDALDARNNLPGLVARQIQEVVEMWVEEAPEGLLDSDDIKEQLDLLGLTGVQLSSGSFLLVQTIMQNPDFIQGLSQVLPCALPWPILLSSTRAALLQQLIGLACQLHSNASPLLQATSSAALRLAIQAGLKPSSLMDTLFTSPHGQQMFLLFNATTCVPELLSAISGTDESAGQVSELMLRGAVNSLHAYSNSTEGISAVPPGATGASPVVLPDVNLDSFMAAMLSHMHLLQPLLSGSARQSSIALTDLPDQRALFLQLLHMVLSLSPTLFFSKAAPAHQTEPVVVCSPEHHDVETGTKVGVEFVVEAYIMCLTMPGRDGLKIRTQACRLLPQMLSGLCVARSHVVIGQVPALNTDSTIQDAAVCKVITNCQHLLQNLLKAVQWLADEYWSGDSRLIPKHGSAAAALKVQLGAVVNAMAELCRLKGDWVGWDPTPSVTSAQSEEEKSSLSALALRALLDSLLPVIQQMGSASEGSGHLLQHDLSAALSSVAAAAWAPALIAERNQQAVAAVRAHSQAMVASLSMSGSHGQQGEGEVEGLTASAPTAQSLDSSISSSLVALDAAEAAAAKEACSCPPASSLPPLATCLLTGCWSVVLDPAYSCSWELRQGLLDYMLMELMRQAPRMCRIRLFKDLLPESLAQLERDMPVEQGHLKISLFKRQACHCVLEAMYATVSAADLQEWIFNPLGPSFKNARIMKVTLEDARGIGQLANSALLKNSVEGSLSNELLLRKVRCSAFNACAALVAATQTKSKFFAMPLELADASPGGIWTHLLDVQKPVPIFTELTHTSTRKLSLGVQSLEKEAIGASQSQSTSSYTSLLSQGRSDSGIRSHKGSLASKLSASQLIDPQEASYLPISLNSEHERKTPQTTAAASTSAAQGNSQLELPPHLWAALEQQWEEEDVRSNGGHAGLGRGTVAAARVLVSVDDDLDRHPCMVPLVLMLERANGLECHPADQGAPLPEWAVSLLRALSADDQSSPRYVKVFLSKAILHVEARMAVNQQRQAALKIKKAAFKRQAALSAAMSAAAGNSSIQAPLSGLVETTGGSHPSNQLLDSLLPTEDPEPGVLGAEEWVRPNTNQEIARNASDDSGTVFSKFSYLFFPLMMKVLVNPEGSSSQSVQDTRKDTKYCFHYLLREFCVVCLTAWGGLFERAGIPGSTPLAATQLPLTGRVSLKHDQVAPAASQLLHHLIICSPSATSEVRSANINLVRMLLQKWGSAVKLASSDFLQLLQPPQRPQNPHSTSSLPQPKRPRHVTGGSDYSGSGLRSSRHVPDHQVLVALKLLSSAFTFGQGKTMLQDDSFGDLWSTIRRLCDASSTVRLPPLGVTREVGRASSLMMSCLEGRQGLAADSQGNSILQLSEVENEVVGLVWAMFNSQGARMAHHIPAFLGSLALYRPSLLPRCLVPLVSVLPRLEPRNIAEALDLLVPVAGQLASHGLLQELLHEERYAVTAGAASAALQRRALKVLKPLLLLEPPENSRSNVQRLMFLFTLHQDPGCRQQLLDLLQSAWHLHPSWRSELRASLAVLLCDDDGEVRQAALKHWDAVLQRTVAKRMTELLNIFVDPLLHRTPAWRDRVQSRWPALAGLLILRLSQAHPDYSTVPLFTHSLAECKFQDQQVFTQAAATLNFMVHGVAGLAVADGLAAGMVRATQGDSGTVLWPTINLTLAPEASENLARLQRSAYHLHGSGKILAGTPASSASLASSSQVDVYDTMRGLGPGHSQIGTPNLSRRVVRHAPSSGYQLGLLKRRKEAMEVMRREARRKKVDVVRAYRTGELPDIQGLKALSFFGPLAQMVDRDAACAKAWLACTADLLVEVADTSSATAQKQVSMKKAMVMKSYFLGKNITEHKQTCQKDISASLKWIHEPILNRGHKLNVIKAS
ncbi:hypothetical protein CEUSTIGMA_g1591.t1 [Chlamydomonas eustigma]|uniref:DNA-dependent protein kinase catalytic subunit CC3 domain-containing protein n=1 Tax=Chlamydomonas eustigma TaxID=1157962 RepID=A0A250WU29_9CHLO|nr:hypothetical protein CEUSTIGMA_g1591.t1 [Chlamydomonas eustigma]|eukprot:GAX74142.1 hypothetical protein CEUSTIGMA_g1591.t1 [Chlamydomonas eustigma]